jgi:hypothetical protein
MNQGSTWPSMEMPLSSYSAISLFSFQRAGQRAGLVADAFHHAAVAQEHVGVVVDDVVAGAVEFGGEQLLGQRHADRVARPWPSGPVVVSTPGVTPYFRVARRLAVQLAEALDLAHRQVVAGQVQQRVQQHRPWPFDSTKRSRSAQCGLAGLCAGGATTARRRCRPCPSACPGGRVGRLDGVHRERADGVGHQRGHRRGGGGCGRDDVRDLGHGRLFLDVRQRGRNRRF